MGTEERPEMREIKICGGIILLTPSHEDPISTAADEYDTVTDKQRQRRRRGGAGKCHAGISARRTDVCVVAWVGKVVEK